MPQSDRNAATECADSSDVLSPDEISAKIEQFSDADWVRLHRAANYFSWRAGATAGDLLHEALARALEGRRKCPRKTGVVTFLGNAIRSIASEDDTDVDLVELKPSLEFDKKDGSQFRADALDPCEMAHANIAGERLRKEALALFDDDDDAKFMFEAMIDEIEGDELRDLLGMSEKDFDSKRRLVRRRLNKHFEGQKP